MRYVADTNIFNRIADGLLDRHQLPVGAELVATHVQQDEISRTKNPTRRELLLGIFELHQDVRAPTESMIWDHSRWDEGKWGTSGYFNLIQKALDARNGSKANNLADSLIAEVAVVNDYGLITADVDLAEVTRSFIEPSRVVLVE